MLAWLRLLRLFGLPLRVFLVESGFFVLIELWDDSDELQYRLPDKLLGDEQTLEESLPFGDSTTSKIALILDHFVVDSPAGFISPLVAFLLLLDVPTNHASPLVALVLPFDELTDATFVLLLLRDGPAEVTLLSMVFLLPGGQADTASPLETLPLKLNNSAYVALLVFLQPDACTDSTLMLTLFWLLVKPADIFSPSPMGRLLLVPCVVATKTGA